MPHDKNGLSIQKDDEVIVRFRVVDVFGDNTGEFCNVNLESLEPMPGSGAKTSLTAINTRQTECLRGLIVHKKL